MNCDHKCLQGVNDRLGDSLEKVEIAKTFGEMFMECKKMVISE